MTDQRWPKAEGLRTERLTLEPLRVAHADEMTDILDDASLYTFTGGSPLTRTALRARYESLLAGQSPTGHEGWLNWVVRRCDTGEAIGYVQATVERNGDDRSADLAWVIGTAHQHRGYATESARVVACWLLRQDVHALTAHIHPAHAASMAVARAIGLIDTGGLDADGEMILGFPPGAS
jgi:RimJ/RimL family protein N-acetyltransferase